MFTSVFNESLQRDTDVTMTDGVGDRYVGNTYVLDVPVDGVTVYLSVEVTNSEVECLFVLEMSGTRHVGVYRHIKGPRRVP